MVRLLQITASVGDGHTAVHLPASFKRYPIVPYWYGNDLYVRAATKEYESLCGMRITSIGEMAMGQVKSRISSMMSRAENNIRIDPDWTSFVNGQDPVMERIVSDCLSP